MLYINKKVNLEQGDQLIVEILPHDYTECGGMDSSGEISQIKVIVEILNLLRKWLPDLFRSVRVRISPFNEHIFIFPKDKLRFKPDDAYEHLLASLSKEQFRSTIEGSVD